MIIWAELHLNTVIDDHSITITVRDSKVECHADQRTRIECRSPETGQGKRRIRIRVRIGGIFRTGIFVLDCCHTIIRKDDDNIFISDTADSHRTIRLEIYPKRISGRVSIIGSVLDTVDEYTGNCLRIWRIVIADIVFFVDITIIRIIKCTDIDCTGSTVNRKGNGCAVDKNVV